MLTVWLPVPAHCFHPGMSQAAQALSPFESEHKMLSAALLSSSFAHYPPLPALQPVASLAGHPPGALNPLGVDSSACSQLNREIVLCVTLCVPAGLCWPSLNPAGFHGQG